jgi:acyl-CoA synthetase (AMP-forming)/AMP-acid ligase II
VDPDQLLMLYPRAVVGGELYGVPTSYANWNAYMATNQELYRSGGYGPPLGSDECYLTALQLMHVAGHVGSFPFLHLGLPQVLVPRFNAKVVVDEIDAHQVTTMFAVPGMLSRMADEVEGGGTPRLGSLRRVLYGGAPVETDEIKRYVRVFGPTLSQLYGRYEAGWPLTILDPADHARLVLGDVEVVGSCGRVIGAVEVELGAAGSKGGREVRSRSGMASAAFVDLDRWCGLGDTGMFTEHGYLHLTGRLDGMINSGSFHVYPDEVREAILGVPGVSAALVVGEPDPAWGEAVVAYVVSTDPKIADTLRGALRDRLAAYKIPTVVHLVESLPGASAK